MSHSDLLLIAFLLLPAAALAGFVRLYRGGGTRRSGGARLALGNLLLLVFLAGLLVAGGEVYYRFVFDQTDGYHITRTSVRWIERHYQRNDRGVRDDVDYADAPDPAKMRVTFLGDSFTNGHGVKQVADRFVNRIRADRPEWEVHSFAEDGLDTGPILERLERLTATGYRLEVVVYVYCLNDISDLVPEWAAAASRLYDEQPGYLVRHSFLINTWYYRLRISRDPELTGYFDQIARAYDGPAWKRQAGRLRAVRDRVAAAGGRLLVVGFPFLEQRQGPLFDPAQARLAGLWAELNVPYLDLLPVFEGRPTAELSVNRYDSHPNPEAHRLAAAAIEAFIERESGAWTSLHTP